MNCSDNKKFDIIIKKNDTFPFVTYNLDFCHEIDLSQDGIFVTFSMWANSYLNSYINLTDTLISFKKNFNITAAEAGDYILLKKYNSKEYLRVSSLNYNSIVVDRAQLETESMEWEKGSSLKIIKILDVEAEKQIEYNETLNLNGSTENVISSQKLIYNWLEGDTSNPGEYFMEFKISKIIEDELKWTKKFPVDREGISIKITDDSLEI